MSQELRPPPDHGQPREGDPRTFASRRARRMHEDAAARSSAPAADPTARSVTAHSALAAADPVRRSAARQAARSRRPLGRARVSRLKLWTGLGLLVVPSVVVGGAAYAGDLITTERTLQPGGSAVIDTGTALSSGESGMTVVLPGRPVGNAVYLGLEMRRTGQSLYRAKARVTPDGSLGVDLSKVVNGTEYALGTKLLPVKVGSGTQSVNLQGSVSGTSSTTLGVRAWLPGTQAPAWQLTATDTSSPLTGNGSVRRWAYLSKKATAPLTLRFTDLATGSSSTPTTPPAATVTPPVTTPTNPPTSSTSPTSATTPVVTPSTSQPTAGGAGQAPKLTAVVASSGANLDTNYPIPNGAVFVAPNGSSANPGTEAAPLSSLAAAIAKAPAGGTVVLRGGTYREAAGTATKKLTIQAYPHEKPVLAGTDVVTAWTPSGNLWRTTSWKSPFGQNSFRAEEVPAGTAAGKVEQVYRNGSSLRQVLTLAELSSGEFWVDPSTLQVYLADNPAGATMELTTRGRGLTLDAGASGSKVLGLRFTGYGTPHLDDSGQLVVQAPGTLIENSQFDHSSGAGLKISTNNITVQHITASDNAGEGMQGNRNHDSLVANSQFNNNNTDHFKVSGCGASCTIAGFKTAHTDNLTVRDNAFVGNDGNGFWCDLGCTDATVTGNAVSGGYDGIFYEVSSRGTITNNYIEAADKGIRVSGSDHVTISGNVLVNNNWQFTVYDDRRSSSTDSYSAGLGLSWDTTNLTIKSNEVQGGSKTTKLLEANATPQIASPQAYKETSGNQVAGNQTMTWCPTNNSCKGYASITEWKTASGLSF